MLILQNDYLAMILISIFSCNHYKRTIMQLKFTRITPLIGIFAILLLGSCQSVRYTDYGRPLDFLRADHNKKKKAEIITPTEHVAEFTTTEKADIADVAEAPEYRETEEPPIKSPAVSADEAELVEGAPQKMEAPETVAVEVPERTEANQTNWLDRLKPVIPSGNLMQVKTKKEPASPLSESDILLIILCIILPPLAVYLMDGIGTSFWLDLILTLIFWLPGVIFAFIVYAGS